MKTRKGQGAVRSAIVFVAVVVSTAGSAGAQTEAPPAIDAKARLERAIADYAVAQSETDREARVAGFDRAAQGFAALVEGGVHTAPLYTNLGNAALQAGDLGEAVLAYRRALELDPTSVTATQNLAHLRSLLPAWVPRPGTSDALAGLRLDLQMPPRVRRLVGAACFAFAALALVVAGRRPGGVGRGLAAAFGIGWGLMLASEWAGRSEGDGRAAVVVADETVARSSDSVLAPLAFPDPLPRGVEVMLLEERDEFARIRLANDRDVWVRRSAVETVSG